MATRQQVAKKKIDIDANSVSFTFGNGTVLTASPAGYAPEIVTRLTLHGLGQKIGDSYAGVAGNVDQAIENAQTIMELLASGEWSEEREGGIRPSLVGDGVVRVLIANGKMQADDTAAIEAKKAEYVGKDGADKRKNAMLRKDVMAAVDAIKAELAAERAAKSAEAAKEAGGTAPAVDLEAL